MLDKEFNLSQHYWSYAQEKIIKEFIKRDWELILDYIAGRISVCKLTEKRDKLAGDKLK